MRKKDSEITDRAILDALIVKAQVCRLGLCLHDEPYVVPVNFGYRGDSLFVHGAPEGRKLDIIRQNSTVCFEMEGDVDVIPGATPCKWTTHYWSVIGLGHARIVTDPGEKTEALAVIMEHYAGEQRYDFPSEIVERTAIIRIDIESMTGKRLGLEIPAGATGLTL